MEYEEFWELVNRYKIGVLQSFEDHRHGLVHPHPGVVMQAAIQIGNVVADAGGIVTCLKREGYDNQAFYRTIGLVGHLLYDAAMSVDCGGLSPQIVSGLENAVHKLEPSITDTEVEATSRQLLRY